MVVRETVQYASLSASGRKIVEIGMDHKSNKRNGVFGRIIVQPFRPVGEFLRRLYGINLINILTADTADERDNLEMKNPFKSA